VENCQEIDMYVRSSLRAIPQMPRCGEVGGVLRFGLLWSGFLLLCLAGALIGCANPQGLDSVQVSPTAQALAVGQTAQFSATGTYGNATHLSTQSITSGVTWTSSAPSVATVTASGLATAVGSGSTTITASAGGYSGPVSASATVTVSGSSGGQAGGTIVSISVIPGSQTVPAPTQTAQFLAVGSTSSGATVNLTNQVAWSSSSTAIATIGAATGVATAVGQGTATITALYSSNGTVVTGTATFSVSGGTTEKYTAVSILPGAQALSASGQTGQFVALGTSGTTGLQTNVTGSSQITWSSSIPTVATVSASGLATGVGVGSTTITALLTNTDGTVVSNTASISVSLTSPPEPLLSLTIIPSSITVDNLQDTGQFLAIGTFSTAPYVRDLTNSPTVSWISDVPSVFPVDTNSGGNAGATAGLVTAFGSGNANIIAEATGSDGTIQTASATFNCPLALPNPSGDPPTPGTCIPGTQAPSLLATLTVYNEGLNSTDWEVTASSATGTADVIHCGPGWALNGGTGGSVCVATYPFPPNGATITVILIAPATGANFGGWSYNCTPSTSTGVPLPGPTYYTAAGPNYCTVTFSTSSTTADTNVTVGAIFN
jgi:uncharacterized protein YjdB